jgi:hypothetical protein
MWINASPSKIDRLKALAVSWGHTVSGSITTNKVKWIWANSGNVDQLTTYLTSLGLTVDGGGSSAGTAMGCLGLTYSS